MEGSGCVPRPGRFSWRAVFLLAWVASTAGEVLDPPLFNLAEGRKIVSTATCGEGVYEPELYCKLVGANSDRQYNPNINLIQGQVCDFCDPNDLKLAHPAENAIDGTEKWWQSPPLSRGNKYNTVNLTIDLGQEFHVAYVFIKMGNSPRPGVWVLERSTDNGETYNPWQYFADTKGDCVQYFGEKALQRLEKDDSVVCETRFSKVVPLEGGEIVVSLLNDRPNADNFSYSAVLQEWTKATNIRLKFLRTKTLLGHLMSVARQDPTVTRRYFYSIKDINIGGRCVCNGHAETCDLTDPSNPYKLLCRCQHNTCGAQCEQCCTGFQQKEWRRAIVDHPFVCEPCNCFSHSDECIYDEEIDKKRQSLDIYGHYQGGGVCKNCRHNTQGINCNQCKPTFYRPFGRLLNATDVCQHCNCDLSFSTGNCSDGNGQCECRHEFLPPHCNTCNIGYYGYPQCRPCDCHQNGTLESVCEVGGGQCPCKPHYSGHNCNHCAEGFYGFPDCLPCDCNPSTSVSRVCAEADGQCVCQGKYGGRQCNQCRAGHYNYPSCQDCACDPTGCLEEICDSSTGSCLCRSGYGGQRCDRCAPGYFGYPHCQECQCNEQGALSGVCDNNGRCRCLNNYAGLKCDKCSPGYYNFPECLSCGCSHDGSIGVSCDDEGICHCQSNFDGEKCDICREGFYNFPLCEECNCNPAGVLATFLGCGSLTSGELCECKERVMGRICNECKPLYWNLKLGNPYGCEDCGCFSDGIVGGIGVCEQQSGQCMCKPNVASRQCSECQDGFYQLDRDDLLGCKDCGCDIGGSVNPVCDKISGKCSCRPRINGRRCNEPLLTHYFPTLFQHQYEIEDGRTPVGTQVRYGYEENIFPNFSWRGYAVYSDLQKEVLLDVDVDKPSLYQVFFRYLNFGGENIFGTITFTPETFVEIQQNSDMVFETTMQPKFMRVSGKQGLTASPFVLNPGRWTVSIRVEKPLFLDYMVLLPQSYYEATLLQEHIHTPCGLNGNSHEMCQNFRYPHVPQDSEIVRGEAGYVADGDERIQTKLYTEEEVLQEIHGEKMAWLDKDQHSLHMDFRVKRPGPHIVLITYHTPDGGRSTTATVEVTTASRMEKGKAIFYDCTYSFHCRQVVIDQSGQVAIFDLDSNFASVILETEDDSSIAIDNVALVPADFWHADYIVPKPMCVRENGDCVESLYFPIPESTKLEFESGLNEDRIASNVPSEIIDSDVKLIYLNNDDRVVDVHGSVPITGLYTFVIHYYQPDHPEFRAHVIIQNGQFYEAAAPLSFCPSVSGCRAVVQAKDNNATAFQILENYVISVEQPDDKSVWLDYLLTIPSDQFHDKYLNPLPQDKAGKFITECGQDSFYLSSEIEGFCREATFSLTSEYNNGALPCQCDTDGSLSYECEQFGGQCLCKPNVIGRKCSQCKTGFFGFPNCKACDCPSTAYCHPVTGQCICPPRVTGERCNTCVADTYGFDPIIGCEECDCNPLGVSQGSLQCDLQTGQCKCKPNVVGRTCDRCKPGYWAFPYCQLCNCDLRGTTEEICDQDSARCFCKENVYGDSCDQCKPGTYFLEEMHPQGCIKCFCFGTTDRCSSALLSLTQVLDMESWEKLGVKLDNDMTVTNVSDVSLVTVGDIIQAVIPPDFASGNLFYFSAPEAYLGNKISSYGGTLSYTILTILQRDVPFESSVGPNLVLVGNNITIVHDYLEQPAGDIPLEVHVNLVEREFQHLSGREVTREQMMMVLVNLEYLLIRGSYFHPSQEIRLSNVLLDVASDFVLDAPQALKVEQCHCPSGYMGNSCETPAPGHYRAKTGPYLGYSVPCQCHGHATSCDVHTGICEGCSHNTIGDYCEMCGPGYHGDATRGSPYDCLICACPIPLESNNFGESCEVSPSGSEISCMCQTGYLGARCSACAAGYFGRPEVIGSSCQPCKCSGNIDPSYPGSCDSVTGDCVLCLNNTFGSACEICAPGFYGDAIVRKDCIKCYCDTCGTQHCDNADGRCECWPNVEGENCDKCSPNFWGFQSCVGCRHCNCGPASQHQQCDVETGQCVCHPGAGGLTCDVCESGFWKYSERGCESCNCAEKYSAGAVCDAISGQCQCLPGVVGEKCDSCPYRWVFLNNQGCLECGPCVHGLLDETDRLEEIIKPVMVEMQDISTSYFANKRLQNVNRTAGNLKIAIDGMISDPSKVDFSDFVFEVQTLEKQKDGLDKASSKTVNHANKGAIDADNTRISALDAEKLIQDTIKNAKDIVHELAELSEGLLGSSLPNIEYLIVEAERFLDTIKDKNFEPFVNSSTDELNEAQDLLQQITSFKSPVVSNKEMLEEQLERLLKLDTLLHELNNNSKKAYEVAETAQSLQLASKNIPVKQLLEEINELKTEVSEILEKAMDLLEQAKRFAEMSQTSYESLDKAVDRLQLAVRDLKDTLNDLDDNLSEIRPIYEQAKEHASMLMEQAAVLENMFADTRVSADAAVQAANAYKNIVKSIDDGFSSAESAVDASEQAASMSDGVAERANESRERSLELLNEASSLQNKNSELVPLLQNAKDDVLYVAQQNGKTSRGLDVIAKDLDKMPLHTLSALAGHAANGSALAHNEAQKALEKIHDIVDKLPEDKNQADLAVESVDDTLQAIKAAHKFVDRVSSIIPDTNDLMDEASKKESVLKIIGTDVGDKLAKLRQKVALARNQADRIKLGVQFYENTTLQVRNPEGIQRAATYTQMSLYFKTVERYGLLAFVGNEKDAHLQMKHVRTDDYLGLEIRGGRIVLIMDLGSGFQEIQHQSYVSDGRWHQVVLERTGKTCTLTVRTEGESDVTVEDHLRGRYSVLNLDQNISKFYIGGISEKDKQKIPDTIKNHRFDGCIEEVEFGKIPVGLWNFVHAENNENGCDERDALVVQEPSNGLRFSGSGYVILPRKKLNFASDTYIKMKFKTYAPEGLLFLIGKKNDDFLALELRDGKVVLKYELGSGMAEIMSGETYNDGRWHSVEATRAETDSILKIDNVETGSAVSPGSQKTLSTTNQMFVGGYPGSHSYDAVTNAGFEGCIMDVQISADIIDLNKNKEALGVVNGCPVTIARLVSFNNETTGYVAMPTMDLGNVAEITFKFKTSEENGQLFYAANEDQSSFLSIALLDGILVMKSEPGGEIQTSQDIKYNDKEWHYVSAVKANNQMRMDVDDIDSVESALPEDAKVVVTTPLYFGGVADVHASKQNAIPLYAFIGCLGDTTFNNKFQNFAESQDRQVASLASCSLTDADMEPTFSFTTSAPSVTETTTLTGNEDEEEEDNEIETESPEPEHVGQCALPLHPRQEKTKSQEGKRFGNTANSRIEYVKPDSFFNTIVDASTFALEFRSTLQSGIMFYVAGSKHVDFLGLFMHDGKIVYVFNCGTGSAIISSQNMYNDGKWHRAVFSRQGTDGILIVDEDEEVRGTSLGSATSVNVRSPFYIGGLSEEVARQAKNNFKGITTSFPGCIRKVEAQGTTLTSKKPNASYNVTGCLDKVEDGTFFSADGGYIVLYDKYRVGIQRQITIDIKPRSLSGVIMAVHGNKDYLLLQMVDGKVSFSVDNGRGVITTTFTPTDENLLCNGNWHTIAVAKVGNVVTLSVDSVSAEPGFGRSSVSSTDTDDPLYIGGVPDPSTTKGVETTEQFTGCIRYLAIDDAPQNLAQSRVFGNVRLNTCSTV